MGQVIVFSALTKLIEKCPLGWGRVFFTGFGISKVVDMPGWEQ